MPYQRKYVSRFCPTSSTALLVLLTTAGLGVSATLGYDNSMMGGLNTLPVYKNYFHLNTATIGLNTASIYIGEILGCFLVQPIPDLFGRKKAIWTASAVLLFGIILQSAAQNIAMFVVARVIVGIGAAFADAVFPTLLAELLPAKSRGPLIGLFFTFYKIGSLLSSIINYGSAHIQSTWAWRIPSILQFVPSLVTVTLLPIIPESPRWLISKGREDEAREVLLVLQGGKDDEAQALGDMLAIKSVIAQEAELDSSHPFKELFFSPRNRKRLFLLIAFGVMVQTWGNFIISYYINTILDAVGITNTIAQNQVNVSINCYTLVVSVVSSFLLNVLGRRTQSLIAGIGMTASLFIEGALTKLYGAGHNESGIYASIALIFIFQGFYSFGVSPLVSLYPQEISYYKIRAAGAATCRMVSVMISLVFSFAMSYAMGSLKWKFYMINGAWDVVFVIIIYFAWVETKGLGLEEIAVKFDGPSILEGTELKSVHGVISSEEAPVTKEDKTPIKIEGDAL